jgi:hypothetical protein
MMSLLVNNYFNVVADSQYVEALEREVRERETYDVLHQLRTEAETVVGRHLILQLHFTFFLIVQKPIKESKRASIPQNRAHDLL